MRSQQRHAPTKCRFATIRPGKTAVPATTTAIVCGRSPCCWHRSGPSATAVRAAAGPKPRAMRRPGANREACVSEQRFKRLLALDTPAELLRPLRRVLALLAQAGHPVDLYDLAAALYRWDERRRKNWAYAYFARSDETARPDAAPVQP
ncbi:MAG TPA: type I-E CRISPR-associated protein Cse2/CasB [Plasticicumulans sp.]|nr:type I-E CRISPR-associated protein Cse2/CasB [Plasticicumulans sp.]